MFLHGLVHNAAAAASAADANADADALLRSACILCCDRRRAIVRACGSQKFHWALVSGMCVEC